MTFSAPEELATTVLFCFFLRLDCLELVSQVVVGLCLGARVQRGNPLNLHCKKPPSDEDVRGTGPGRSPSGHRDLGSMPVFTTQ